MCIAFLHSCRIFDPFAGVKFDRPISARAFQYNRFSSPRPPGAPSLSTARMNTITRPKRMLPAEVESMRINMATLWCLLATLDLFEHAHHGSFSRQKKIKETVASGEEQTVRVMLK